MIDFYTYPTINGQAVAIALSLLQIPHNIHAVDLTKDQQRQPEFLAINPSGRIPVIVDEVEGQPLVVSQTGAILIYLAEKYNKLLSADVRLKVQTIQWMQFVLTDINTNVFNNFHLKALVTPKQPVAAGLLKQRAINFCHEIEQHLNQQTYLIGDKISLADVVAFPPVDLMKMTLLNERNPNLCRWHHELSGNPAFITGMK